ncbi:MAG: sigma-70 family RNA polymerase sigma factor [Oscillospiraceae bacterium]|nr:sigma-70 family RNA polymerase sigma factor [Oscillospiraceae bacterium]
MTYTDTPGNKSVPESYADTKKNSDSLPSRTPLSEMTSSELYDLVCKADSKDEAAFRMIFESFEAMVMTAAAENANELHSAEELANDGFIALLRAVQHAAENAETDFLGYAESMIRTVIKDQAEAISISREAFMRNRGILSRYNSIVEKTVAPPAPEEMGLPEDVPAEGYRRIINTLRNFTEYVSHLIDESGGREEVFSSMTAVEEQLYKACSEEALSVSEDRLWEILSSDVLSEREKKILGLRFGLDGSSPIDEAEIGKRTGLTRARVLHIVTKALKRICSHVNSEDIFTEEELQDLE